MRSITTCDIIIHHFTLLVEQPVNIVRYKVDGQIQGIEQVDCFIVLTEDMGIVDS